MRHALLVLGLVACSPRSAKITTTIGGAAVVTGAGTIYYGHCCIPHSGSAPDGRIVAYPFGGALIIAGTIAALTGLLSLAAE